VCVIGSTAGRSFWGVCETLTYLGGVISSRKRASLPLGGNEVLDLQGIWGGAAVRGLQARGRGRDVIA
jgi:hypothetical protein